MKSSSPALTAFLLNIQDRVAGTSGQFAMEDLYAFILGNGFIVVNYSQTPAGGGAIILPPTIGTNTSVFLVDLGVKQAADYSPLTWVPSSPGIGQYTVNNSTATYTFNGADTGAKLFTYAFYIGPVQPTMMFFTSGGQSINYAGTTYQGGNSFTNRGVIDRAKTKTTIGLAVDEVETTLRALPTMQMPVNNVPVLTGLAQGYFDAAPVLVQRLIMPTYGDISLGSVIWFKGTVGDVTELGRTHAKFQIRSRLELLNTPLPRNLIGISCNRVLFDAGCLLAETSFSYAGTVQSGSNVSQIVTNLTQVAQAPGPTSNPSLSLASPAGVNLNARIEWVRQTAVYTGLGESLPGPEVNSGSISGAKLLVVASPSAISGSSGYNVYIGDAPGNEQLQNATPIPYGTSFTENVNGFTTGSPVPIIATNGYFSQGVVTFVTGANAGLRRIVQTYTNNGSNNVLNIIPPLPNAPSPGDTFVVSAGCDKRSSTCNTKFANLIHFSGFSYVPDPAQIV